VSDLDKLRRQWGLFYTKTDESFSGKDVAWRLIHLKLLTALRKLEDFIGMPRKCGLRGDFDRPHPSLADGNPPSVD
jgi:hypothetical protein